MKMVFSFFKPTHVFFLVFSCILLSSPNLSALSENDMSKYIGLSKTHLLEAINARRTENGKAACTLAPELNQHAQRVSDFQALVQSSSVTHPDKAKEESSSVAELPIIVPVASQCKESKVTLDNPKSNADVALCLLNLSPQYQEMLYGSIPFCGIAITFGPSQMSPESFYWVIQLSYSNPSIPSLTNVAKLNLDERKQWASKFWSSNSKKSGVEELHLTMFAIENQPLKSVYQALGPPEESEKLKGVIGKELKQGREQEIVIDQGKEVNRLPRSTVETKEDTTILPQETQPRVAAPLIMDTRPRDSTQADTNSVPRTTTSTEKGTEFKPEELTSKDAVSQTPGPLNGQTGYAVEERTPIVSPSNVQAPQTGPASPYSSGAAPIQPRVSSSNTGNASPVSVTTTAPKGSQPKNTSPGVTQWSTSKAPLPIINSYNRCQCPVGFYVQCGNGPY